jgi:hypothetical protein
MIKNINLVKEINDTNPKGMNNVSLETLAQVTNNFVEHIDCVCLDELAIQPRNQVFPIILSKLCIGGSLSLKMINTGLLANKIKKSELTGDKLSTILPHVNSVWSDNEISDYINKYSLLIKGMYYDNIYTIYQLEKTV